MQFASGHTLARIRTAGTDRYGDPLPEERTEIHGCGVAPTTTDSVEDFRQSVTTGYQVMLPPGYTVDATDLFELPAPFGTPNDKWKVVGEVQPWVSPFSGWAPGTIVHLRRRTG